MPVRSNLSEKMNDIRPLSHGLVSTMSYDSSNPHLIKSAMASKNMTRREPRIFSILLSRMD